MSAVSTSVSDTVLHISIHGKPDSFSLAQCQDSEGAMLLRAGDTCHTRGRLLLGYHHASACIQGLSCRRRLAWVLGFAMGPYGCMERTWKPFNPILGETFEVDLDKGVRFFAEQVRAEAAMPQRMWPCHGHNTVGCLVMGTVFKARCKSMCRCHIIHRSALVMVRMTTGRTTSCPRPPRSSWATALRSTPLVSPVLLHGP